MEVIATATFGLLVWVVLWALGVSGLDGIIIGGILFLIALAIQNLASRVGPTADQ